MAKGMNRREFLKTSAAAGAMLVAGDLVSGSVSAARGVVNMPEAEKATVTVLADNFYSCAVPSKGIAKRYLIPSGAPITDYGLHAEHGLVLHVETVVDGISHAFIYDFGTDPRGVLRNMDLLKIDYSKLEALALSHGHWDHYMTLLPMLKTKGLVMRKGIPLYVGEDAFDETFWRHPDKTVMSLGALNRKEIESLGFVQIVEVKDPTQIVPGAYMSGTIDMVTEYEKGQAPLLKKKGGQFQQDFFIGEQAVILNIKGKGPVVLSGCAHRGIANAVKQTLKITGRKKIHAVIGGFHLMWSKPELIQRTVADIKAASPDYIIPNHCTGFEATMAFAAQMPAQFMFSTVGTQFTFGA
ncbi:MAG: twin-arginine translocation signal domain-containing protein [Deltaproteobacteria bacterium]|nr:twin-arginine translocation signal domain-containing protein [Deltaproteobacteria bacterium]